MTDFERMTDLRATAAGTAADEFASHDPHGRRRRAVDRRHAQVRARAGRRPPDRVGVHPRHAAMTFCISTQVGCAMACGFCLTGKMGLVRHLDRGRNRRQVRVLAAADRPARPPVQHRADGDGRAAAQLRQHDEGAAHAHSEHGLAISPRRVTLSTVGIVPGLERLAREPLMPNLAISLHATTDEQRTALVPPNRKYPLAEILEACRRFPLKKRSRITFEYVLLDGVNDTPDDARRLVKLLSGIKAKVNLIPLNPAPGIPFERPSDERVDRFAQILADRHLTVSVRKSRGRDIRAACGQLIVEGGIEEDGGAADGAADGPLISVLGRPRSR